MDQKPQTVDQKNSVVPNNPISYCEFVSDLPIDNPHRMHHDLVHGFAVTDDNELFARLVLEINQAGLSWLTILKKEKNFRRAYSGFDISTVASYDDNEKQRLLSDAGIIRNRLKVDAAIHNARVIVGLQHEYGSFKTWLDNHHPLSREEWTKLFRATFKFTGGEIVNEFMMSTGYLRGAHINTCPVYEKVLLTRPKWYTVETGTYKSAPHH
jgi:DNA-3-methyladenine glycosylase I